MICFHLIGPEPRLRSATQAAAVHRRITPSLDGAALGIALLARRMIERGVRFVQFFHRGWDQHGNVAGHLPTQCKDVDQPCWALINDLKQRTGPSGDGLVSVW